MTITLAALHRARYLNQIAEQQKLFGNRGLARIRVRDYSKSASSLDFIEKITI